MPHALGSLLARTAGLFAFWLILAGIQPVDLPVGIVAAVVAAWASVRLLPPGAWHFLPVSLSRLVLRFLRQSITAGIDAAWRALDPRLPLQPGFVRYRPGLSPGPALSAFCTMTSLLVA